MHRVPGMDNPHPVSTSSACPPSSADIVSMRSRRHQARGALARPCSQSRVAPRLLEWVRDVSIGAGVVTRRTVQCIAAGECRLAMSPGLRSNSALLRMRQPPVGHSAASIAVVISSLGCTGAPVHGGPDIFGVVVGVGAKRRRQGEDPRTKHDQPSPTFVDV